jgi:hypothetical protein
VHAVTCKRGTSNRKAKHDSVVRTVASFAREAGYSVLVDKRTPGAIERGRPGDIYLLQAIDGKDVAIDISISSPHNNNNQQRAARVQGGAGYAANASAEAKRRKYAAHAAANNIELRPATAEIYGGWGKETKAIFKVIITRYAQEHSVPMSIATNRFYYRVGITLARFTANMILERHARRGQQQDALQEI